MTKKSDIKKDSNTEHQFNWFSLRVISGKERVVEDNIMYESKISNVEDNIEEVFVPFEKVVKIRNNKKIIKERVFFPGYILIKMKLNKVTKYFIENIQGVISFVGPKGKNPIPLREAEIKKIFGEVERKEGREMIVSPFKKNDSVKIIAGPFIDFTGAVDEINDDTHSYNVMKSNVGWENNGVEMSSSGYFIYRDEEKALYELIYPSYFNYYGGVWDATTEEFVDNGWTPHSDNMDSVMFYLPFSKCISWSFR